MNEGIKLALKDLHTTMGIELAKNTESPDYDQGVLDGLEQAIDIVEKYQRYD